MQLVRNTGYLKTRRRLARLTVFTGAVSFGLAIVLTYRPETILFGYGVLFVGFLVFNAGMQQIGKWSRRPRPDELLDDALRRLSDRYTLIHFARVGSHHVEHVLVGSNGLLVITTREVDGRVRVEDNRWRRHGGFFGRILGFSGPVLGSPTFDCLRDQRQLRDFLEREGLPGADQVDGLIAFVNPRVELEVVSSDLTAVPASELLRTIREFGTETVLTTSEREQIVAALSRGDQVEGPVSLPTRDPRAKDARAA